MENSSRTCNEKWFSRSGEYFYLKPLVNFWIFGPGNAKNVENWKLVAVFSNFVIFNTFRKRLSFSTKKKTPSKMSLIVLLIASFAFSPQNVFHGLLMLIKRHLFKIIIVSFAMASQLIPWNTERLCSFTLRVARLNGALKRYVVSNSRAILNS